MNEKISRRITRRGFLKLAGFAAAAAAGVGLLDTCAPWLEYPENPNLQGISMNPKTNDLYFELIRAAVLAASGHNTQPWKFSLPGDGVRIHPDYSRRLPVVDPADRELWISLGCALENLLTAAAAAGLAGQAADPGIGDFIAVRFAEAEPSSGPAFRAITSRQNTRSVFDGLPLSPEEMAALQALPLEAGVRLRFYQLTELDVLSAYIRRGNLAQYADRAFVDELIGWLRFNKKEALTSRDGLFSRCSGNPEVPRFIGRMFVAGTKPEAQAEADDKKLRSSAGAVLIATDSDSKAAWARAGQVYQRLALAMTSMGIKSALLNQPIEVAALRAEFGQAAGLGQAWPQLLVRFGRAPEMPRSLRRPVEEVLA